VKEMLVTKTDWAEKKANEISYSLAQWTKREGDMVTYYEHQTNVFAQALREAEARGRRDREAFELLYRKALERIRDNCACNTPEVCYDVAVEALSGEDDKRGS
jgi:hypothetical protein